MGASESWRWCSFRSVRRCQNDGEMLVCSGRNCSGVAAIELLAMAGSYAEKRAMVRRKGACERSWIMHYRHQV